MALEMTDYTEDLVIDRFFRNQAFTPPAAVYLGLYTTATDDDGTGTEVGGGSYARAAITLTAPTTGDAENDSVLAFVNMPAETITHAAILDDPSAGNMLWHGSLTTPKTTAAGQTIEVAAGDLTVGFTAGSSATTWLRNQIINHTLRNQAYTPGTVYQALYTTATDISGGGTEVTGGSYARSAVTFSGPIGGVTSNPDPVDITGMPIATATHGAILDALTTGNMMLQAALNSSVTTGAGDTVRFDVGDLTYTVQ